MAMDLKLVSLIRGAREDLIKAMAINAPKELQLPEGWVRRFEAFESSGFSNQTFISMQADHYLGVKLIVTPPDGADDAAILTLSDGSEVRVVLGVP